MGLELADRLERAEGDHTITALPDGSVDAYCDVTTPRGESVDSRERFAEVVAESRTASVVLDRIALEPGGHAVHAAAQADVLGADVTCFGYLDDAAFDVTPFESVSMGRPAHLTVCEFDDGDVVLQERSGDRDGWTLDALRDAAGDAFRDALTADAVVCANWASFDGMAAALSDLAALDADGDWFVFDASGIGASDADEVRDLCAALGSLSASYDAVLTGNREELDAVADALDCSGRTDEATLAAVREAVGVAAVVRHEKPKAVAATEDGETSVTNVSVEDPVRRTGAGDHFVGGMADALVRGWDWAETLRLGNLCASHYVATGRTGSPAELQALLDDSDAA
jgi:sugar/nucleoside kinase (ribokinase family)